MNKLTETLNNCKCNKTTKKVMLESGSEDIENLIGPKKQKQQEAMKQADATSDNIGMNYLKIINTMAFSDLSIYIAKLLVFKHGRPEVKKAKMGEVNNLLDYDVFEEVKDEGQGIIGTRW